MTEPMLAKPAPPGDGQRCCACSEHVSGSCYAAVVLEDESVLYAHHGACLQRTRDAHVGAVSRVYEVERRAPTAIAWERACDLAEKSTN